MAGDGSSILVLLLVHKIEQLLWAFDFFFFFCFGGWSTTLMAASKTALTFYTPR